MDIGSRYAREVEIRWLEAFVVVAEELHFGRAAQRLHVAQSPLSQTIRRLDASIGTELFERNTRSVALTRSRTGSADIDSMELSSGPRRMNRSMAVRRPKRPAPISKTAASSAS